MTTYKITIDRLVLTDMDLSPAESEALRGQLIASLQRALAGHEWSPDGTAVQADRVRLADIRVERSGHVPAGDIALNLVQALPGTSHGRGGG
jgi:hypothetical protein